MPEKVMPGPVSDDSRIREAVSVHTKKIMDACRDKDCVEDLRVYPTKGSRQALEQAISVKAGQAELLYVSADVEPISFNRGFYTVDVRYFYRVTADAFVGARRPAEIEGLAVFDKRVILFGSEGSSKTFYSDGSNRGPSGANQPTAVVEDVIYAQLSITLNIHKIPLLSHKGGGPRWPPPYSVTKEVSMETQNSFDYYYGDESEQFRFLRVPKVLMKSPLFRDLSSGAKLLYGLLLDRMGLSARNGWYDNQGRVFIYYSLVEIQEELSCCHDTATKWLRELETIGLIERKKQGQGKPAIIYVKKFTTRQLPPSPSEPVEPTPNPDSRSQDFSKPAVQTSENRKSGVRKNRSQECDFFAGNKTEKNYTDYIYTDLSINRINHTYYDRIGAAGKAPFRQLQENLPCSALPESTPTTSSHYLPSEHPGTAAPSAPLYSPAWNLVAQIPLFRGRAPNTPRTERTMMISCVHATTISAYGSMTGNWTTCESRPP